MAAYRRVAKCQSHRPSAATILATRALPYVSSIHPQAEAALRRSAAS